MAEAAGLGQLFSTVGHLFWTVKVADGRFVLPKQGRQTGCSTEGCGATAKCSCVVVGLPQCPVFCDLSHLAQIAGMQTALRTILVGRGPST
jgi:hypothetical protein